METNRIYMTLFLCFLLGIVLLVVIPPGGAAGAGLTHGMVGLFRSPVPLVIIALLIFVSMKLYQNAWGLLFVMFVMSFLGGGLCALDMMLYHNITNIGIGALVLVLLLMLFLDHRHLLLCALIIMPSGFFSGGEAIDNVKEEIDTLYYLFGHIIALGVLTATSASLVVLFNEEDEIEAVDQEEIKNPVVRPPHAP